MGYADGLLSSGERVVHREKQHWWVFVWGARYTILAVIIAVVFFFLGGSLAADGAAGTFRMVLGWVTAALFIGGLALLFWTTLRYLNQEYVLTNRRVIQVEGVVNKRAVDSSLEKINDAVLTQSIFGRALGFGDLKILTASEAAISDFKMLVRPIDFKKAMLEAKHDYELEVAGGNAYDPPAPPMRTEPAAPSVQPVAASAAAAASPAVAAPPPGPIGDETMATAVPGSPPPAAIGSDELTRTLASLADLRDRGAISAEEYERKKAEILGRL
jgi:Bacterial PH domain/Short C-terminal domain